MKKSSVTKPQQAPSIDHPELSFNQYLLILFRLSVVFFDMNYKGGNSSTTASN